MFFFLMSFLWYRPGLCVCNCVQNTILRQTFGINEKEILSSKLLNFKNTNQRILFVWFDIIEVNSTVELISCD